MRTYMGIGFSGLLTAITLASCKGEKKEVSLGTELEPAVLGGGGGGSDRNGSRARASGSILVDSCSLVAKSLPVSDIVPVTQIIEASSGIAGWSAADLPFTGSPVNLGSPVTDGQTPFQFTFTYPPNNYQFTEAHIVIDTARDSSDTEGIFVDGVFSGRPPNMVNGSSTKILHKLYSNAGGAVGGTGQNTYYIDFSLAHYKQSTRNTFDLLVKNLLSPSPLTADQVLQDGQLNVVTGDDSPVYQAYLVIKGLTIASGTLTCANSNDITFTNVYLHNDGNTIGSAAFSGSIGTPYSSWSSPGSFSSFEMNYDSPLPLVDIDNITLSTAQLNATAKRSTAGGNAAMVVNGVGISTAGFNRALATAAVEEWDDGATAAFTTFFGAVTTTSAPVTLDLIAIFGETKVRELLAQGKLNVAVAGNLYLQAANATVNRALGSPVSGPELNLAGTYFAKVCNVPNEPNSPLSQIGFTAPEPQMEKICKKVPQNSSTTQNSVIDNGSGPVIASLQVLDISSNSATIVWATDKASDSTVNYGVGNLLSTVKETALTTFHKIKLTGLSSYKFYDFQIVTKDKFGNQSKSDASVLRTLR